MKNIKELTEKEATEILEFVYPKRIKNNSFRGIKHEPSLSEDGKGQYITFGGRSIIGIEYHNGQDRCILHFDNTKCVLWLYKNGYDIQEFLEANSHFSEVEQDFEMMAYVVHCLSKGEDEFRDGYKQNWTLEYVKKKCTEIYDKYFIKDYE